MNRCIWEKTTRLLSERIKRQKAKWIARRIRRGSGRPMWIKDKYGVTCRLYPDDNLDLAMNHFGRYNVDELPVLEGRHSRRLLGSVHRQQVIEAYNREIFRRDLAGSFQGVVTAAL